MSGGGEPTYSVDQLNAAVATIKPPDPNGPMGWVYKDNPSEPGEGDGLSNYYRAETQKKIKELQGPTPQEQMQEAMRLIVRENSTGRIPDPDYDIVPRSSDAYSKIDINALSLQRARDYADDLEQDLKTKGEEYSKAERERIIANRQAEELKKLTESTASDDERTKARDDRRMRLLLGQSKLKAGSSLLSDEKTSSGSTLLTG